MDKPPCVHSGEFIGLCGWKRNLFIQFYILAFSYAETPFSKNHMHTRYGFETQFYLYIATRYTYLKWINELGVRITYDENNVYLNIM